MTFVTKSSQIARTFLRPFSWTFGLAYSPSKLTTLSCSSEVTLATKYDYYGNYGGNGRPSGQQSAVGGVSAAPAQ